MGRYTSYGIATLYVIPLKDMEATIRRRLTGKTIADFNVEDLYTIYPKGVYDIVQTEDSVRIELKECYTGTDIMSLLKDFATITPYKNQLKPESIEEIGQKIEGRSMKDVLALAQKQEYYGFQDLDLPYYLYWTKVPIGDNWVYAKTMVKGIMIGYGYSKTDTEDDTDPYRFLTGLLRYRLKENPLSATLLAYLSV